MNSRNEKLNAAIDVYSGDWDAAGTNTVHFPAEVAEALLFARGWDRRSLPGGDKWVAPEGEITSWDREEALQWALAAEVL